MLSIFWYLQTGESSSPGFEVKVAHLGDRNFRVQTDGVSMDVSLAVYSKVNFVYVDFQPQSKVHLSLNQYAVE